LKLILKETGFDFDVDKGKCGTIVVELKHNKILNIAFLPQVILRLGKLKGATYINVLERSKGSGRSISAQAIN